MEQITITKDDFHKAIEVALKKMTDELKEQNNSPLAGFAIPMVGVLFSKDVEAILFKDKDKDKEPKQEG